MRILKAIRRLRRRRLRSWKKELKRLQKERKFKSVEPVFDEEHNLWEVRFVSSQGSEHAIKLGAGLQRGVPGS